MHAWTGHKRHEQDFVIASTIFEVKTQVVTVDRMIGISSEDQLEAVQGRILVCNLGIASAPEGSTGSCTLNSIAKELADLAKEIGSVASDLLGMGMLGAGYEPRPEYSEETWIPVDRVLNEVRDEFPRIETGDLRPGLEQVHYRIRVSNCQEFAVDLEATFGELIDG